MGHGQLWVFHHWISETHFRFLLFVCPFKQSNIESERVLSIFQATWLITKRFILPSQTLRVSLVILQYRIPDVTALSKYKTAITILTFVKSPNRKMLTIQCLLSHIFPPSCHISSSCVCPLSSPCFNFKSGHGVSFWVLAQVSLFLSSTT